MILKILIATIFINVGYFVEIIFLTQIILILFYGIPITLKLKKLNAFENNIPLKKYLIALTIPSVIIIGISIMIYNIFYEYSRLYLIGFVAALIISIGQYRANRNNAITEYYENNSHYFTDEFLQNFPVDELDNFNIISESMIESIHSKMSQEILTSNNYIEYKKLIFNIDFDQDKSILRICENSIYEIGTDLRFRLLITYTTRILQSCYPPQFLPIKKCLEDFYSSIENFNDNYDYTLTNAMYNVINETLSENEKWAINHIFENESSNFLDTPPIFEVMESDTSTVKDKIFNYKITLLIQDNYTLLGIDMAINNPTKLFTLLSLGFISDYVLSNLTTTSINYIKKPMLELFENIDDQKFKEKELNNYIIQKHNDKIVSYNLNLGV